MEQMTITEALSEVNLIKKRLEHKRRNTLGLLVKPEHITDTYASEGGTPAFLNKELQSISDLNRRLIKIRGAISRANIDNEITINERTHSIHDWLTWKREVSGAEISYVQTICNNTKAMLDDNSKNPKVYEDGEGKKVLVKFQTNVDYPGMVKKQEELSALLEQLDGKLSLKNATIVVSI